MLRYSGCANCGKMEGLIRCSGCQVTNYCSTQHQSTDYFRHRSSCNRIRKALTTMQIRELAIRAREDNAFARNVGSFWGHHETRPYMRARVKYIDALLVIKSSESIQTQLDLGMESLRLSRSDNMGIREVIPSLIIRLDQDQECYNFVKWWAMASRRSERWGDSPIENANPLESPDWCRWIHWFVLSHVVSMTLLKIKLMFVLMLELGDEKDKRAPDTESMVPVGGSSFMQNQDVVNCQDRLAAIESLKGHIRQLYAIVDKTNRDFWPALVETDKHLGIIPDEFGVGGSEQVQMTLAHTYDSWSNYKPAIDIIDSALKGDMI